MKESEIAKKTQDKKKICLPRKWCKQLNDFEKEKKNRNTKRDVNIIRNTNLKKYIFFSTADIIYIAKLPNHLARILRY